MLEGDSKAWFLIRRVVLTALALMPLFGVSACVVVHTMTVAPLDRSPGVVDTPVRVHMNDGSIVLFRAGARVTTDQVVGAGTRFGLTLADSTAVTSVRLSDVAGMQTYRGQVDGGATVGASMLATTVTMLGMAALCAATNCIQIGVYR